MTWNRRLSLVKNWFKAKRRLAKEHEHVKDFRRDSLSSGFYSYGVRCASGFGGPRLVREERNQKEEDTTPRSRSSVLEWQFKKRKTCFSCPLLQLFARVLSVRGNQSGADFGRQSVSLSLLWLYFRPRS